MTMNSWSCCLHLQSAETSPPHMVWFTSLDSYSLPGTGFRCQDKHGIITESTCKFLNFFPGANPRLWEMVKKIENWECPQQGHVLNAWSAANGATSTGDENFRRLSQVAQCYTWTPGPSSPSSACCPTSTLWHMYPLTVWCSQDSPRIKTIN